MGIQDAHGVFIVFTPLGFVAIKKMPYIPHAGAYILQPIYPVCYKPETHTHRVWVLP